MEKILTIVHLCKDMSKFLDTIKQSKLQDYIVNTRSYANELTLEVKTDHILDVLKILKEDYKFDYLADISAIDNYAENQRFAVVYNLVSLTNSQRLRVTCSVDEAQPELDSAVELWEAANWFEREAFDMMGIKFRNHPDLRRMYMPEDYEFYPLRKEFPLLGIPGSIPLPEKDPPKEYK